MELPRTQEPLSLLICYFFLKVLVYALPSLTLKDSTFYPLKPLM